MKKCKKCGAIQSDDRNLCIDCGALLGESLSEAEAARAEAEFADKIDTLGDRTEDFHVSARERVLGIVSIVLAALLLVSAWINGARLGEINRELPDKIMKIVGSDGAQYFLWGEELIEADEATVALAKQGDRLENALLYDLIGAFCFGMAAVLFLMPKMVWFLSTLRYRLWFNHDTSPSDFAIGVIQILKYALFVLGCTALIIVVPNMF